MEKHNFCLVRGSLCESMTVGASLQTTVSISQKSCISIGRGKYQGWSRETADNACAENNRSVKTLNGNQKQDWLGKCTMFSDRPCLEGPLICTMARISIAATASTTVESHNIG